MRTTRDYRLFGGVTGKSVSLGDFDAWMDAQMHGRGDTSAVYKSVAWAFRCVQLRANAVAGMPYTITKAGSEDAVDAPWPLTRLLWNSEAALCTWGCFYWLKRTNRVMVKDLQWLNPMTMTVKRNEQGIQYFEQHTGGAPIIYQPQQIVYGRLWNPTDDLGPGVAPLEVAFDAAGIALHLNHWASAFFEHGAIPTILLHTETTLPSGEPDRIQAAWQRMVGGLQNAWKAIVLQGGLKPEVITPPVNTLALPELSQQTRAQIATALGVPETLLSDSANFATAISHRQSFILDTIAPECELIAETVNAQLLSLLGLELKFRPQDLDILQEDEADRAASLQQLTGAGVPLKLGMEILGYDLTDEQWRLLEQAEEEKRQAAEREFELQKERFAQPVAVQAGGNQGNARGAADAMRSDLRLWQRKAVKRVKDGESLAFDFKSDAIPAHIRTGIAFDLSGCADVEAVKAVFAPHLDEPGSYAPLVVALNEATRKLDACATPAVTN